MKALLTTILFFGLISIAANAKVWRVSNKDTTADFTDIDIAHNSPQVNNRDTLYIDGSSDYYTNFTCTKQLVIIGPGYFLNANQKTANSVSARIGVITFNAGSEGSLIMGLELSDVKIYTNNIIVERCYIKGTLTLKSVTGIRINDNYLGRLEDNISAGTIFDDVHFNNNIVTGNMSIENSCTITSCNNNIFLGNSYTFVAYTFRNNIIVANDASLDINSLHLEKNIATNNILSGDNLNVSDIDALFIGGNSLDAKYILSEDSQAKGAGYGGIDCGVYGGSNPYLLSGLPPIPIVTDLEVDDAADVNKGLNVKIEVTSY